MKRQNIRKMLLILSFLLFPVTIYYLSPYLIIQGASEGIATGSFVVFSLLFLASLFFGRLFCGWICPVGGLQECCRIVSDKKAKGQKRDWIKYLIWAPWLILIAVVLIKSGGVKVVDFFYQTVYGISVAEPSGYIIYYFVILLIIILAFTAGRRSFCHYACWIAPFMVIGRKISNWTRIPSLRLAVEKKNCISCKQCNSKRGA